MALATLNEGEVQPLGPGLEVFVGAQLHPGRVGGDLAHHTAQLPHPHLHAQRHQRYLPTRGQGTSASKASSTSRMCARADSGSGPCICWCSSCKLITLPLSSRIRLANS